MSDPGSPKLFSLDGSRFDLSSYAGRCQNFFEIFNPLLLLTNDSQLSEARALLHRFETHEIRQEEVAADPSLNASLWNAKKLVEAMLHPQTHEKIPLPFRMSAFVPMNFPIAVGMLMSQSQVAGLFWQWYNQSYNVCVNYANGNKTNPMPASEVAKAYALAVASSCGVHWGLNQFLTKSSSFSLGMRAVLSKTIPYTAVGSAGALNVLLMRYNEMSQGIAVCDEDGNEVGISKIAGRRAILQTALSRVVLPAPILLFPPMILRAFESTKFVQARPRVVLPLNLFIITTMLWGALPCAIGLFPQMSPISPQKLEPEFHALGHGTLWYNKGL